MDEDEQLKLINSINRTYDMLVANATTQDEENRLEEERQRHLRKAEEN